MQLLKHYIIESIPKLNEVFGGGIHEESMIHIYGPFQSGKSLLVIQVLYEMIGKRFGNGLYLDTEASVVNNFGTLWWERFNARFKSEVYMDKLDISKVKKTREGKKYLKEVRAVIEDVLNELGIDFDQTLLERALSILMPGIELISSSTSKSKMLYVLDRLDLTLLLNLLNIYADITRNGNKMEVSVRKYGDIFASPLSVFINKFKIKFLVLDSLGMLIKPLIGGLQDLPARATVTNLILNSLMRLVSHYKLIVFVLNHETELKLEQLLDFGAANISRQISLIPI